VKKRESSEKTQQKHFGSTSAMFFPVIFQKFSNVLFLPDSLRPTALPETSATIYKASTCFMLIVAE